MRAQRCQLTPGHSAQQLLGGRQAEGVYFERAFPAPAHLCLNSLLLQSPSIDPEDLCP